MIAASGFANVINTTSGVKELVDALSTGAIQSKRRCRILNVTRWVIDYHGYWFFFLNCTNYYLNLCTTLSLFWFLTTCDSRYRRCSSSIRDAGSPASDSTLGPTSGLNIDGKHDHIWDSVVPTFIHYNIPLLAFGWIAAMTL